VYYEYICRRAGISVHYCAEQFNNDGSSVATIVKGVKRAMAGEYSREVSAKVFAGQCHPVELGFRQGGAPGFGLRRMLLDQAGNPKGILARGEQKSLQTDRVILAPGPPEEIEVANRIYRLFVEESKPESEIAQLLNASGIRTDLESGVDTQHHPPGPDESQVHRQQRLQLGLLLVEEEARGKPSGDVDPARRRFCAYRCGERLLYGARHSARTEPPVFRFGVAGPSEAAVGEGGPSFRRPH
jgi:hypothetical protein